MPVILEELENNTASQVSDPKFFSSDLTGKGSTVGLLSIKNNPGSISPDIDSKINHKDIKKTTIVNGYTETRQIPLSLIKPGLKHHLQHIAYPDVSEMAWLGNQNNVDIYMDMQLNAIIIEKTSIPANAVLSPAQKNAIGPNGRKITTNYELRFFAIGNSSDKTAKLTDLITAIDQKNYYLRTYSDNPLKDIKAITNHPQFAISPHNISLQAAMDYIQNYDIYQAAIEQSENWQEHAADIIKEFTSNMQTLTMKRQIMAEQVQWIMTYNVPLNLYRDIYQDIQAKFQPDVVYAICKQNLNLLLSNTMSELNNSKTQIPRFTIPANITEPKSMAMLSTEQGRAVRSTEPLILVQAGAGSGKSTLILNRIEYLQACGVKPEDITVLSFTNAAADHITEKNPNVHSMTIARMIHEIYSANFANHELSTIDTILNSIDIYFPAKPGTKDPVKHEFKQHLYEISKQSPAPNSTTNLNNFIEEHFDEVIDILNTIKQTSLELEIIICYQKIGIFKEPVHVASKYLIIDEVQDNSIFEFIYMLKYVNKHKENLFIVGDCSQTLYEFRAANPRALNILESSNTFATYQLNVNYRSNQEILDFANVTLRDIEANQYANIQLRANALTPVTEQSFLDKVNVRYARLNNQKEFKDALTVAVGRDMDPYIQKCLNKGEQIAFLARSRATVYAIKDVLEHKYTNKNIVNIMPERSVPQTVMSTFIRLYWDEIKFVPPGNIMAVIAQAIMDRLDRMPIKCRNKDTAKYVQSFLRDWMAKSNLTISVWTNQLNTNQLTLPVFLDLVKENMLQYEMQYNAIRQSMTSTKNQQNKDVDKLKNADILLSTIHSAKGLEFDNVVVICENKKLNNEEDKRLYYVAFTRAMKTEYIWAYDTVASPKIEADYNEILERLHSIAPAINSPIANRKNNKRVMI